MTSTTSPIIAQAQDQFEALLEVVAGPGNRELSAAAAELTIFRGLLRLGATLLGLFFEQRGAERPVGPVISPAGVSLPYHDRRSISYTSIFGKLTIWRHAFTVTGQPVICPLDAELSLPARCYSDLLLEWAAYGATAGAYRESQTMLERLLELPVSVQAIETGVQEAAADVAAFVTEPVAAPTSEPPGRLLVVQADGKGVPMVPAETGATPASRAVRRGKGQPSGTKKEAIVTAVYTIEPAERSPAEVAARLLPAAEVPASGRPVKPPTWPRPVNKELRASLDGKTAAVTRLAARADEYDGPGITQRVALTDGADALQRAMLTLLPTYTLVLDIIHAVEYLWAAANGLLGERHPDRTDWVRTCLVQLLSGQVTAVISDLEGVAEAGTTSAAARAQLLRTAGYYRRNAPFMRYDAYLAAGWPIGTGVIEGACGHLVKDRMEQAGMRWTKVGAQAVLDLRAVRLNGEWDAYWAFHRRRAHARRYGSAPPALVPVDLHGLAPAA
jgi:hypothetical protein